MLNIWSRVLILTFVCNRFIYFKKVCTLIHRRDKNKCRTDYGWFSNHGTLHPICQASSSSKEKYGNPLLFSFVFVFGACLCLVQGYWGNEQLKALDPFLDFVYFDVVFGYIFSFCYSILRRWSSRELVLKIPTKKKSFPHFYS